LVAAATWGAVDLRRVSLRSKGAKSVQSRLRGALAALLMATALLPTLGSAAGSLSYMRDAMMNPPEVEVIPARGGGTLELYHIDTQPNPTGTIFFVPGSGCASLRFYLRRYFADLPGSWRIYAVQKVGVAPMSTGGRCSREFDAHAVMDEILDHNRQALDHVVTQRGPLKAVFGVSEGASLAARLAVDNTGVERLVAIGSGALTMREDIRILAGRQNQLAKVEADMAAVATDPQSLDRRFLGLPYRYWTSSLDVDPAESYLRVTQPAYFVQGERDESVPVESGRALQARLAAANRTNYRFQFVEGASHILVRDGQDLKPAVMRAIATWMNAR
jgi:pimeloyl-ACP methyl ester carboxylesterase